MSGLNAREQVMEHRRAKLDDDEVLDTEERSVLDIGEDASLYHNIPRTARRILDLDPGDTIRISMAADRYVVEKVEE